MTDTGQDTGQDTGKDTGTKPYIFENRGRSRRAVVALVLIYAVLLALVTFIDMSLWIAGALALTTLPAAYELVTDPRSGLTLDENGLAWFTARTRDSLPLALLDKARFDTRLDLSVRMTLILRDGRRIRLPHAATPPHRSFEAALTARGIAVERHHFSLIG